MKTCRNPDVFRNNPCRSRPPHCERDCRTCSYAAALDCDGNCGVCPHNGYCPCVNPVVARSKTALRLIELRPILLQDLQARN